MLPRCLFVLVLCSKTLLGHGQLYPLSSFHEVPLPKMGSPEWCQLNHGKDYAVKKVGDKLFLSDGVEPTTTALLTPAGKFIGHDAGEWGGSLVFQASGATAAPVEIRKGNVRFLFQVRGTVYFLEGLAHLSYNHGALYQLTGQAPAFGYTKVLDLEDAPEVCAIEQGNVFIAQSEGFTILRNLQPDILVKEAFWGGLYPNSLAIFGQDTVYIGMRGGYAQLNTATKKLKFFQR